MFILTITLANNAGSVTQKFAEYKEALKYAFDFQVSRPNCTYEIVAEQRSEYEH